MEVGTAYVLSLPSRRHWAVVLRVHGYYRPGQPSESGASFESPPSWLLSHYLG